MQLKTCVDSPASKRSVGGGRKRTKVLQIKDVFCGKLNTSKGVTRNCLNLGS